MSLQPFAYEKIQALHSNELARGYTLISITIFIEKYLRRDIIKLVVFSRIGRIWRIFGSFLLLKLWIITEFFLQLLNLNYKFFACSNVIFFLLVVFSRIGRISRIFGNFLSLELWIITDFLCSCLILTTNFLLVKRFFLNLTARRSNDFVFLSIFETAIYWSRI